MVYIQSPYSISLITSLVPQIIVFVYYIIYFIFPVFMWATTPWGVVCGMCPPYLLQYVTFVDFKGLHSFIFSGLLTVIVIVQSTSFHYTPRFNKTILPFISFLFLRIYEHEWYVCFHLRLYLNNLTRLK